MPGTIKFSNKLDINARSRMEEVAMYCFMLNHFVADSCRPCHCDARRLSAYNNGLHKEMEAGWSKVVGTYFKKTNYLKNNDTPTKVLIESRVIDNKFDIEFSNNVPDLQAKDPWLEIINICRASFAVAAVLMPPSSISYDSTKKTSFKKVFKSNDGDDNLLVDFNRMAMHDAVLNIAILWKSVWNNFN